ncbi:unnamed protein product [Sympodiomycopsis kandeliae]
MPVACPIPVVFLTKTVAVLVDRKEEHHTPSVLCRYANSLSSKGSLGDVPVDCPWLPSWSQIKEAYNLTPNLYSNKSFPMTKRRQTPWPGSKWPSSLDHYTWPRTLASMRTSRSMPSNRNTGF